MNAHGLHVLTEDLSDTWLAEWIAAGIADVEAFLAKHAAFLSFLEAEEA